MASILVVQVVHRSLTSKIMKRDEETFETSLYVYHLCIKSPGQKKTFPVRPPREVASIAEFQAQLSLTDKRN